MPVDDDGDWVEFGKTDPFRSSKSCSARTKEKDDRKRNTRESTSSRDKSASSWMETPISSDSSWLPIPAPRYQDSPKERDSSDRRGNQTPTSCPPRLARSTHVTSSGSGDFIPDMASSSISRSSSGSSRDPPGSDAGQPGRGRSTHEDSRQARGRSRSKQRSKSKTRTPSASPAKVTRSTSRTRPTSRTRVASSSPAWERQSTSRTRVASPLPTRERQSTSRTRVASPSPTRERQSTSRTRIKSPSPTRRPPDCRTRVDSSSPQRSRPSMRPPLSSPKAVTRGCSGAESRGRCSSRTRSESESRGRSSRRTCSESKPRSASRSKVITSPSPSHHSNPRVHRANSCGAVPPLRHAQSMSERSVSSEQIHSRSQSNGLGSRLTMPATKLSRKQKFMEKFFGDKVSTGGKGNVDLTPRSVSDANVRVGSPTTEQCGNFIHPRVLLCATIYKNAATNLWIATINTNQKGVATNPKTASKYLKAFSFSSEREAREAAIANAPPKMMPFDECPNCFVCNGKFAVFRRACHCRNCGVCICNGCTTTWSSKMLPETYNLKNESAVKVCKRCSYLTDSFRNALLGGDLEESIFLYEIGNINLRCPLPPAMGVNKGELMYPIHCAVQGGNLEIFRWLVDVHYCPIKSVTKTSNGKGRKGKQSDDGTAILTSKGRSVLSIAMSALKVDIVRYLVVEKGVTVYEVKDLNLSLRALEAVLLAFPVNRDNLPFESDGIAVPRWDDEYFDDDGASYEGSSLGGEDVSELTQAEEFVVDFGEQNHNVDTCIICCDNTIDCVITPCGHQICCLECSSNIKNCPVCNVECGYIRIFKP